MIILSPDSSLKSKRFQQPAVNFKMAEKGKVTTAWTAEKIYHFALCSFASVLYDLLLVLFQVFEPYIPDFWRAFIYTALSPMHAGSAFLRDLVSESDDLRSGSPVDDAAGSLPVFGGQGGQEKKVLNGDFPYDRAPIECTADVVIVDFNRVDFKEKLSFLGKKFRHVGSQLTNYQSDNLDITTAGSRQTSSIFPTLGESCCKFCFRGLLRMIQCSK